MTSEMFATGGCGEVKSSIFGAQRR